MLRLHQQAGHFWTSTNRTKRMIDDDANGPSTTGHEQAMPKSETSSSAGNGMTALDILSSCALALSGSDVDGGDSVAWELKEPMPPAVVSPTTPEVSVSPSTMTTEGAAGQSGMTKAKATPMPKKTLVRPREVSACSIASDVSAKDSSTLDAAAIAASAASSFSDTLSSCISDVTQPISQRLRSSMKQSQQSLKDLQEWDRRQG